MKIVVACIGRLKAGPERELFDRYWSRFQALGRVHGFGPCSCREFPESRAGSVEQRRVDEAARLIAAGGNARLVALDETGSATTSVAFARFLLEQRDAGGGGLALLIGGADGLDPDVRRQARLVLSLGAMTLPHGLARVLLAEQLYRAATIIAGHPYHRG
jgi:23S rRNA (pseudouridine1915-N3)-methyltransferase